MIESVLSWLGSSAIPNPHAVLVHFPVALLPVALLLDLGCIVFRKRIWLDRTASMLYVLGTIGAAGAYLTGRIASQEMWTIAGEAQATMADHEDLALLTLLAYCIVTLLRTVVTWLARDDWRIKFGFFRLLALMASAAALVLLVVTADLGGALVYRHGIGVDMATSDRPPADPNQ